MKRPAPPRALLLALARAGMRGVWRFSLVAGPDGGSRLTPERHDGGGGDAASFDVGPPGSLADALGDAGGDHPRWGDCWFELPSFGPTHCRWYALGPDSYVLRFARRDRHPPLVPPAVPAEVFAIARSARWRGRVVVVTGRAASGKTALECALLAAEPCGVRVASPIGELLPAQIPCIDPGGLPGRMAEACAVAAVRRPSMISFGDVLATETAAVAFASAGPAFSVLVCVPGGYPGEAVMRLSDLLGPGSLPRVGDALHAVITVVAARSPAGAPVRLYDVAEPVAHLTADDVRIGGAQALESRFRTLHSAAHAFERGVSDGTLSRDSLDSETLRAWRQRADVPT